MRNRRRPATSRRPSFLSPPSPPSTPPHSPRSQPPQAGMHPLQRRFPPPHTTFLVLRRLNIRLPMRPRRRRLPPFLQIPHLRLGMLISHQHLPPTSPQLLHIQLLPMQIPRIPRHPIPRSHPTLISLRLPVTAPPRRPLIRLRISIFLGIIPHPHSVHLRHFPIHQPLPLHGLHIFHRRRRHQLLPLIMLHPRHHRIIMHPPIPSHHQLPR